MTSIWREIRALERRITALEDKVADLRVSAGTREKSNPVSSKNLPPVPEYTPEGEDLEKEQMEKS